MTTPLRDLALLFGRLGATTFGGPAAHVAMMEEEVVRRRGWLDREAFLDLLGASQLIPGPNSTELAIHIGYARAGWPGLLVAGACFIAPAMLIVWAVAWAYVAYGALPAVGALLAGIKPVVLAVIAQALWSLARSALVSAVTLGIAAVALVAAIMGINEIVILAGAAALAGLDWRLTRGGNLWERGGPAGAIALPATAAPLQQARDALGGAPADSVLSGAGGAVVAAGAAAAAPAAFSLGAMFLYFMKAGALLFGSGYVLLAFLRADFVTRTGWLTEAQLLDAIAVGQFTPGPLFTTATFVGYVVAGNAGALLATLGIFLPAFVFVAVTAPLVQRLRSAPAARAVLGGLNAASLALMLAIALPLGHDALARPLLSVPLFLAALYLAVHQRVNSAWLVLGGALAGWLAA